VQKIDPKRTVAPQFEEVMDLFYDLEAKEKEVQIVKTDLMTNVFKGKDSKMAVVVGKSMEGSRILTNSALAQVAIQRKLVSPVLSCDWPHEACAFL
jgi:hypothetical protein